MNGANNSTDFTDESGKTWTAVDDAKIVTNQAKFRRSSGYFDGAGDYITTPDSADFAVGSGDWTIDYNVKRVGSTFFRTLGTADAAATASTRSIELNINADGKLSAYMYNSGATISTVTIRAIDNNWHHIALVRYVNSLDIYIDGVKSGTPGNMTGKTINDSNQKFAIGALGIFVDNRFNGWIDEFRFSKGIARWTDNFTPPTVPYGVLSSGDVPRGRNRFASNADIRLG